MILRISCVVLALSLAISLWQNEKLRKQLDTSTETLRRLIPVVEACR